MTDHVLTIIAIIVPAVVAIIAALIKTSRRNIPHKQPPTQIDVVKDELDTLKRQVERQHIKIDDLSERLAWLEGRDSKE